MNRELGKQLLLSLAVVALCTAGFFACFEQREIDVWRGASREARNNRYLALARLIERMGHPVSLHSDVSRLGELPEPPATVFLPTPRATLGKARSQALLDWVARGGHLVVVTYSSWEPGKRDGEDPTKLVRQSGPPDLLLDRFGLRQRAKPQKELVEDMAAAAVESGKTAEGAAEPASGDEAEREVQPPRIQPPTTEDLLAGRWQPGTVESAWAWVEDEGEPLEVEFHSGFWWEDTLEVATWSVAGAAGSHLVEFEHGAGTISALTSDEPFVNDSIGRVQNAEFVVRWLRHDRAALVPVWIFHEEAWPSFFELLRRHATPALLGASALVLLWIWRSAFRFGPLLPAPDPARRRWLEHLEAAGRFHWRQDRGHALLASLRGAALHELGRKHPGWAHAPEPLRFEKLAQASGLTQDHVAHAFLGVVTGAKSFIAAVRTLERVRASL